jgi:hypothetical protein
MDERPNSLEAKKIEYINKSFLAGLKLKTSSRKRNPRISHALYNSFDKLKRKNNTRRNAVTANRGAVSANNGRVVSNRGASLKSRSANRRAALNAKNKEKKQLIETIKKEIELKKAGLKAKRQIQREEALSASAGATAEVEEELHPIAEANNNQESEVEEELHPIAEANNNQESEVEEELDAIAELTRMMNNLNRTMNNNNRNAMKP